MLPVSVGERNEKFYIIFSVCIFIAFSFAGIFWKFNKPLYYVHDCDEIYQINNCWMRQHSIRYIFYLFIFRHKHFSRWWCRSSSTKPHRIIILYLVYEINAVEIKVKGKKIIRVNLLTNFELELCWEIESGVLWRFS